VFPEFEAARNSEASLFEFSPTVQAANPKIPATATDIDLVISSLLSYEAGRSNDHAKRILRRRV